MKYILGLIFTGLAFGQATFSIQVATETPVSVTMSAEAISSGTLTIMGTVAPGTCADNSHRQCDVVPNRR